MTSQQIEIVLDVAKTLNLRKSAENLYISQPTLTYQIQLLEKEIGFKIFSRQNKTLGITTAGSYFITEIKKVSKYVNEIILNSQRLEQNYKKIITISLPYRFVLECLPQAIKRLNEIYPNIIVNTDFNWRMRYENYFYGKLDIVFDLNNELSQRKSMTIVDLYETNLNVVCNKDNILANNKILTLENIKNHEIVKFERVNLPYFLPNLENKPDLDSIYISIAANNKIALLPDYLNDHKNNFKWIPLNFKSISTCSLGYNTKNSTNCIKDFVKIIKNFYGGPHKLD